MTIGTTITGLNPQLGLAEPAVMGGAFQMAAAFVCAFRQAPLERNIKLE